MFLYFIGTIAPCQISIIRNLKQKYDSPPRADLIQPTGVNLIPDPCSLPRQRFRVRMAVVPGHCLRAVAHEPPHQAVGHGFYGAGVKRVPQPVRR